MRGVTLNVLNGVDVRLERGETLAVVGPSGAGKSTLLHILGLLEAPTGGSYRFDIQDALGLADTAKAELRLKRIGFIFQFHHLLPEFTALENVMIPSLMLGESRRDGSSRAEILLELVGLKERLHHKPGELSGGEQQRTALARALVNRPALILADEPTGNLDQQSAIKMQELLFSVTQSTGASLLLVTHNADLAARSGRVLKMVGGRLVPL